MKSFKNTFFEYSNACKRSSNRLLWSTAEQISGIFDCQKVTNFSCLLLLFTQLVA